jgi:predicted DCC family thiol-disulfide oxidoreductase YuxK
VNETGKPVLLFDGVCNLCNNVVNFTIKHDPQANFSFASLQSESGQKLLREFNLPTKDFDSFVFVEKGKYFTKSTAALKVVRGLKGLWPLLYGFIIIPAPLRDLAYSYVAKNRYKWFGKKEMCMIPTPDLKKRFLE